MGLFDADIAVYVAGGVVMSLSFVFAIGILHAMPLYTVTGTTLVTFSIGFFLSMVVYYLALWIYRFVAEDETPYVTPEEESSK